MVLAQRGAQAPRDYELVHGAAPTAGTIANCHPEFEARSSK